MPNNSSPRGILSHRDFKEAIPRADFEAYRADPRMRVASPRAFSEMQDHISRLYQGVEAVHSFVDAAGQVFDCIPIEQQPSLRGRSSPLPRAPDLTRLTGRDRQPGQPAGRELHPDRRDRHGNVMACPPGTIPMRRLTLEELGRFPTLGDYFRKAPRKQFAERGVFAADPSDGHRYAYTQQDVPNIGAHNFLSLWDPQVNSNQVFSLSQHWYAGGSGSGHQTLEVGWQVYPAKYNHSLPALFVYWTADNYQSTGAYNLDGPGFVQTSSAITLGGALSPVSVDGGEQEEIEVMVYLYQQNWWLYIGGADPSNAVGYWPVSIYNGGQLGTNAEQILFGGETVTDTGPWPPMGSGQLAAAGWTHAAYHRDIYYFPTSGAAQWASLTAHEPSADVYTVDLEAAADPWNIYFFYGGPGGANV